MPSELHRNEGCNGTFLAWDQRMLEQLSTGVRARFPVVLTHKYACDEAIVGLLRARTLDNSPTALRHNLMEAHSGEWLRRQLMYLSACEGHRRGHQALGLHIPTYEEAPPFPIFPTAKWFLAIYAKDVWSRLPELLAAATSTYGRILKVDSTKKVTKELHSREANTASWATNVGNERGEVLQSVLTVSEAQPSLQKMGDGLVARYTKAGQPPPELLYTDRDCCCESGPSKYHALFAAWDHLCVRLDIWHYMRRLAAGCTSESHPLYGTFMARLSGCIFAWDGEDVQLLMSAKGNELMNAFLIRQRVPLERPSQRRGLQGTAAEGHVV